MALKRILKEAADYTTKAASFNASHHGFHECNDGDFKYLGDTEPDAHREIQLTFGIEDDM